MSKLLSNLLIGKVFEIYKWMIRNHRVVFVIVAHITRHCYKTVGIIWWNDVHHQFFLLCSSNMKQNRLGSVSTECDHRSKCPFFFKLSKLLNNILPQTVKINDDKRIGRIISQLVHLHKQTMKTRIYWFLMWW